MLLEIPNELEVALVESARRRWIDPRALALWALRERFLPASTVQPRDEWERLLLGFATDCGVSLPDSALSSDGLYE